MKTKKKKEKPYFEQYPPIKQHRTKFNQVRQNQKQRLMPEMVRMLNDGVQFDPNEFYKRCTGRTTGAVLKLIAEAYNNPNKAIRLADHFTQEQFKWNERIGDLRPRSEHLLNAVHDTIRKLDLDNFKICQRNLTLTYEFLEWKDL